MYDYAIDGFRRQVGEWSSRSGWVEPRKLTPDDVFRVGCWINLLRNLKVHATPDVVAIYLIATGQRDLLYEFTRNEDTLVDGIETKHWDYVTWNGGYCCAECDPCSCWSYSRRKFRPAREAFIMAYKYLDARVEMFVKTLVDVVDAAARQMEPGHAVVPFIINAIQNSSISIGSSMELSSKLAIVKSIHAMMMPETCNDSSYGTVTAYPLLGYDRAKGNLPNDQQRQFITREFCDKVQTLANYARNGFEYLFNNRKKWGADEFADIKEIICLVSEIVMFVTQAVKGHSFSYFAHMNDISNANKFKWKDMIDSQGDRGCAYLENLEQLLRLKNITPAGALCLGDMLVCEYDYNKVMINECDLDLLEAILPRGSEFTDVLDFMVYEARFCRECARQLREIIQKQWDAKSNWPRHGECECKAEG